MDLARTTLIASVPAALIGAGLMLAARTLIVSTLESARVEVLIRDPSWSTDVLLAGAAALGVGAMAAGGVVLVTARFGSQTPTTRRLLAALGSATAGLATGLSGAAFHTARTAVPAAMGADIGVVTPVVEAQQLMLPGWAAGGVAGGLIVYAALAVLSGLLGPARSHKASP